VLVAAFIAALEPLVEGFPALAAEQGSLALEAVAFLPSREARAELCNIRLAGAPKSAGPLAAQAHAQSAMHQRRREMAHAENAVPAMLAARRAASGDGQQQEQKYGAGIYFQHPPNI
jgi:replication-associated recombination protein RarA